MRADRNALEDLLYVLKRISDAETKDDLLEDLGDIREYWAGPREPWGACVLAEEAGMYLVVHGPKGLCLPGGKPSPGETPEETALRELYEETGYSADLRPLATIVADNGVQTHVFFTDALRGRAVASYEGIPCWVAAHQLIEQGVRFPLLNRRILDSRWSLLK